MRKDSDEFTTQESLKADTMGLAHITLATRDVRRSADFFRDALGLVSLSTRPGNIGMNAAWLDIAPGMELHLIEDPEFEPSRFRKGIWPAHRRHV